ncbi:LysR family transcriptional regulator [Thalassovita sp.]|uniref:LysR family transcriptional regulator n=1 Tax=Thalassovita sp. TaxID=1979401 RepID=UPI002AAFA014|nr:LysR family transcriptional regulator [Thalassovita sp.]
MTAPTPRPEDINWDDLKYIHALARAGSQQGAADALRVTRSTVGRRLEALEQRLGTQLFERRSDGVTLTAAGHHLLPHAEAVADEMAALSRRVAGLDQQMTGLIRLSMPHFLAQSFVMDLLTDFARTWPEVELAIDLSAANANLDQREADLSLRYATEVGDAVLGRRLVTCSLATYCSPKMAATLKQQDDGQGLTWIGSFEPEGQENADWIAHSPYPKARLKHRMSEGATQIAMARAGLGLIRLPCFIGDLTDGLTRAPGSQPVAGRSLWLLRHPDLRHSAKVTALADHLAEGIRAKRSEIEVTV